jgi:membrane protein
MSIKPAWDVIEQTVQEWSADRAPRLGAALAYYTVFSLAPLLLLVMAAASWVLGEDTAQGRIVQEVEHTVGRQVAEAIQQVLKNSHEVGHGGMAAIIGLVVLFIGASGVFVELQDALNTIWKVTPRPGRTLRILIRDRLFSFTAVLGTGFLLLVSLVVSAAISALNEYWAPTALPGGAYVWQGLETAVSFVFITVLFALINKVLPDVQIAWREVWLGAALTGLLFTIGKFLLGLYLGRTSTVSAFGAAGSLVVILIWVFDSSQILLFGAEFIRVYSRRRGIEVRPTENAMLLSAEACVRHGLRPRQPMQPVGAR